MKNYKIEMGKRLKEYRKINHLTQEKIAELLNISVKHYSEVERGITGLSVENIIKVSIILNISIDYLLKGIKMNDNDLINNFFNNLPKENQEDLLKIIISIEDYKNKR